MTRFLLICALFATALPLSLAAVESMQSFCAQKEPLDREAELQVEAVYASYQLKFEQHEPLYAHLSNSLESMRKALRRAGKSQVARANALLEHKKRVCHIYWIAEKLADGTEKL